jgi:hypothetical protein
LVVEWQVPKQCKFWSFALYNDYWQVLNYGNRQIHLNSSMVDVDENNVARIIVSHKDPRVQNWIDLDGHNTGILMGRAKICGEATVPKLTAMPFASLERKALVGMKSVTEDERKQQLVIRREHYLHRYSR